MPLEVILPETKGEFPDEFTKCMNDPYYFYINYWCVNGVPVKETLHISKADFYSFFYRDMVDAMKKQTQNIIKKETPY